MGTYSDYEQRLLDQQSGEEMDRLEQQRERREARDTIATAPIGPAHVFADADNNGLNARVLPAAITSNEQVEQLISEYQLAIDVRSHHTPLGRIDRIKRRCEETIAALQELQQRRSSHEAPPIPPSSNLVAEPTVSEQRAVLNNPAGAVEMIKRQQAEIANLREQLRTAIPAIETLKRTRDELQAALGSNAPETACEHVCEGACETPRLCRVSQECLFARYVKNRPAEEPDCRSNGSQALCSAWPTCRCGRAGAEYFKALRLIRDAAIPQGMSAALFADRVLGGPLQVKTSGDSHG